MSDEKTLQQNFFDEPHGFQFFQAVRLLEKIFPERAAVGGDDLPAREAVQFRSHPTLNFPASEIQAIKTAEATDENAESVAENVEFAVENSASKDSPPLEMFVNFMGLLAATTDLPHHYVESAIDRARYGDTSFWAFADIFTHRAVSLFYRAWAKYRFLPRYERAQKGANEVDDFTHYLFDLIGLGTDGLRGRMAVADENLLLYAGLLARRVRSAIDLEQILSDYFGAPIEIEQFFGQWLILDEESVTRLGAANSRLGTSAIVGTRVFDYQSKFRVRILAKRLDEFKTFLPTGANYRKICDLIGFAVGQEFDFDLQLVLPAPEVPGCILTTRAIRRPQLGWTSYLKTKPFERADEQVVLPRAA